VTYFNKKIVSPKLNHISDEMVAESLLEKAMLFEIAFARGEQLLKGQTEVNWEDCLKVAAQRQKRHFDAKIPEVLSRADKEIAELVGKNLVSMLEHVQKNNFGEILAQSPEIPRYQWIASGQEDFSIGRKLIEIKCTARNFGSADYRQILMYWLLSSSGSIESNMPEWTTGILLNPRRNQIVEISFN
jgi:hypothetical protein